MKTNIKLTCVLLAVVQFTFISCQEQPSSCPNLEVRENLSDPFIAQRVKRELTRDMWKSPMLSKPTELVAQLRNIILEMSDSDSFYFTEFAYQFTEWSTSHLAEADHTYPNLCVYASVINKTVEWQASGNMEKYVDSLNDTYEAIQYALSSLTHASLVEMGCKNISEPLSASETCWQNGLVSSCEEVWNIFGRLMPWPLRNIHNLLVNSPLYIERAYATMLTFILTPAQYFFYTNQRYELLIESGRHYTNAGNVSKCCCDDWNTRMVNLYNLQEQTALNNGNEKASELVFECDKK